MGGHPLVAAGLSALIPGAGQLYARRPGRAAAMFLPTILLAAGGYGFLSQGPVGMASLLVRPTFLSGLLVANVVILIWRAIAVIDAYVITSSTRNRSWMPVTLALVLLAVAVPHTIALSYGTRTISALRTVFVAAPGDIALVPLPQIMMPAFDTVPDPATVPQPTVELPEIQGNAIFRRGFGDPDAIAALGNIYRPSTPFAPFVDAKERLGNGRLTILLVGADAGPGREGLRTDTMIVATIDHETGNAALFGLPRNLKLVPLPHNIRHAFVELEKEVIEKDLTDADEDGYPDLWVDTDGDGIPDEPEFESCHCFPTMLNKVHQYTQNWTASYPRARDPGLSALKDVISYLIDLPIDFYVMVKMEGFVKVVDAIGGVDVNIKAPFHVTVSSPEDGVPKASINVEPGPNHLNGLESLAYVRWRRGSSDYNRMGRQRCLIRAVATQTGSPKLLAAFPTLVELFEQSISTDIPLSFLPDLVKIAGSVDFSNIATVGLVPPTYSSGRTPGKYPIPDVDRIRSKVRQVLSEGVAAQSRSGESECDL